MLARLDVTIRKAFMVLMVGSPLVLVGCASYDLPIATTQSVGDRIKPLEDRLARLEAASAADKTRLDQLTGRVDEQTKQSTEQNRQLTEQAKQLTQTTGTVDRALQTGNAAGQKANDVDGRVARSLANRYKRTLVVEFNVPFESGKTAVSDEARRTLQGAASTLMENPTYTADLVGYTDDVGDARYNVNLSWRREEIIRRLLIEKGVDLNRIFFIGLGEETASGKDVSGRSRDRRGTVRVYRPTD